MSEARVVAERTDSAPLVDTPRRSDVALLAAIVGLCALVGVFAGEHIGVHGGYGWDGITYREILQHPLASVLGRTVNSYTLQRVVPSMIVGGALSALGVVQTGETVARGFGLYNAMLLVACAVMWGACARMLGMSRRAFFIGTTALFVTFAATKQLSYYPALTDTTAFTLGFAVVTAFLARSPAGVAAVALVGSFAWPVVLPLVLPLLLWPRGVAPVESRGARTLAALVAGGITLALLGLFAYLHWVGGRDSAGMGPVVPILAPLVGLSMLLFAGMSFGSLYLLLRGIDVAFVVRILRSLAWRRVLVVAAVAIVVTGAMRALAAPDVPPMLPLRTFLGMLAITPMTRPLITIVAHFSYFGPWILLLVALWPRVAARIQADGAGLIAFACGVTILAFLPESRQASFGVPMLAIYFASVTDQLRLSRAAMVVLTTAAVLLTRVWVRYGDADTPDTAVYREYLSNHGPYMGNAHYAVYAASAVVVAVALFLTMRTPRTGVVPASD